MIIKKQKLNDNLGEEMICTICMDHIYKCITLIDCLHNVIIIENFSFVVVVTMSGKKNLKNVTLILIR
jgi:hypothetical protein